MFIVSTTYVVCCYVLPCSLIVVLCVIRDRNSTQTHLSTREFIVPLTGKSNDIPIMGILDLGTQL